MLSKADKPISEVLPLFSNLDCDVAFLSPTAVAMEKSIIDAASDFRNFLLRNKIHDFTEQGKGNKENGVLLEAFFVATDEFIPTKLSLYRPETKDGDPRTWPYALNKYASANNLIAFCIVNSQIYIINCSDANVFPTVLEKNKPFGSLFTQNNLDPKSIAQELLEKLYAIHDKGPIKTITAGDTGIGMTLEHELGISANSSTAPDYKGIEIKATRRLPGRNNRVNLFSKVPNWKISPIGNAKNLLKKRGKLVEGRLNLYHQMDALKPNSYGLMLVVETDHDLLKQTHVSESDVAEHDHDTSWIIEDLKNSLAKKHKETFWVKANPATKDGVETFHYTDIVHTRNPNIAYFGNLIQEGVVTLDYTMHLRDDGSVRDHGYLFKIHPKNIEALFPAPKNISLLKNKRYLINKRQNAS